MNPSLLSDEELAAALKSALSAQFKPDRVVSWTSNGTSVSKTVATRHELNQLTNALEREAHYRIAEGSASLAAAFPRLHPWKRRPPERLAGFAG